MLSGHILKPMYQRLPVHQGQAAHNLQEQAAVRLRGQAAARHQGQAVNVQQARAIEQVPAPVATVQQKMQEKI